MVTLWATGDVITAARLNNYNCQSISIKPSLAGAPAITIRDTADTVDQIILKEDGSAAFRDGYFSNKASAGEPKTGAYRGASIVWDGCLELWRGDDGVPYIDFKTDYATDYDVRIQKTATHDLSFEVGGSAALVEALRLLASGNVSIGPNELVFGTFGAEDVNLKRVGADILQTDDIFRALKLISNLDGNPAAGLEDTGQIWMRPAFADTATTLRDSPPFTLTARYWDGTISVNRDAAIYHDIWATTPRSTLVFQIAGVDLFKIHDDKSIDVLGELRIGEPMNAGNNAINFVSSLRGTYGPASAIEFPAGTGGRITINTPNSAGAITERMVFQGLVDIGRIDILNAYIDMNDSDVYNVASILGRETGTMYLTAGTGQPLSLQTRNAVGAATDRLTITGGVDIATIGVYNANLQMGSGGLAFGGVAPISQQIYIREPSAGTATFRTDVSGDTVHRFILFADGRMEWGPGTAARDVILKRGGSNILQTDDEFKVVRASAGETALVSGVDGESYPRLWIFNDGTIYIGDGTVDLGDIKLKRDVANVLWTDDAFVSDYVCMAWAYLAVNALLAKWGTGWNRKDTTRFARLIDMGIDDPPFRFQYADAGANPITWATLVDFAKDRIQIYREFVLNREDDGTNAGILNIVDKTTGDMWHIPFRTADNDRLWFNFYDTATDTWHAVLWLMNPARETYAGLVIGGDTNLYRSAADVLKTDDLLELRTVSDNADVLHMPLSGEATLALHRFAGVELGLRDVSLNIVYHRFSKGGHVISPLDADGTTTLRDCFLTLIGKYWDGTVSVERPAKIFHRMYSTTPSSELVFQIAGSDYFKIGDNGVITYRNMKPNTDNTLKVGEGTSRFAEGHFVTLYTGDITLNNGIVISEDLDGVIFKSPRGEELMKLDMEGNLYVKGEIKQWN